MQRHKTPKNELRYPLKAETTRQKSNNFKTQKLKPTQSSKVGLIWDF